MLRLWISTIAQLYYKHKFLYIASFFIPHGTEIAYVGWGGSGSGPWQVHKNIVIMLIGNKSNTLASFVLSQMKMPRESAEKENLLYMETSVLAATDVESAFLTAFTEIYRTVSK